MARKRITEYAAKRLISASFPLQSKRYEYTAGEPPLSLDSSHTFVVKVDQGVKGRMKKGLVHVNVEAKNVANIIKTMQKKGYNHFFIEEYIQHTNEQEHFISLERERNGITVYYSRLGGIHVEQHKENIKKTILDTGNIKKEIKKISEELDVPTAFFESLLKSMDEYFISFLEINPLVAKDKKIYVLDLAIEVDSTAEFFVKNAWSNSDFVDSYMIGRTSEESYVSELARKSQAAFSLQVLNADGSIFLLLSGGGASLVIADEVYDMGYGQELVNYGEYSGNPNAEETYLYTKQLLSLLVKSKAKEKVLIIGGGVANFTDVRITFKGILKALEEDKKELQKQRVKIFVRRGGPHQEEGLHLMKQFLKQEQLYGAVYGPEVMLTQVVHEAIEYLNS